MSEERPWTADEVAATQGQWKVYVCAPPKDGRNGKNHMLVAKMSGGAGRKSKSARTPVKAEAQAAARTWQKELNPPRRKPRVAPEGAVYFIRNVRTKAVKVGWSTNVRQRIRDIQTVCEDRLALEALFHTHDRGTEHRLHRCLASERLHGEWFRGPTVDRLARIIPHADFQRETRTATLHWLASNPDVAGDFESLIAQRLRGQTDDHGFRMGLHQLQRRRSVAS